MNIKPSDKLAFIVKSEAGNEGAIVEILEFAGESPFYDGYYWGVGEGPCWLVKFQRPTRNCHGEKSRIGPVPDAWLKPIRDNPGNESFVTEARKELTKGKTEITEKGEIA